MNTAKAHFGIRIAIVDDQVDQRERMIEFLRCMGHEVTGFALAEELDEYQACKTPDLMILELNLLGEDGCSITRRMRAAHPDMYILMLSSGTSVAERIRCYVQGYRTYMTWQHPKWRSQSCIYEAPVHSP